MADLDIRLLGPPRIEIGGTPLKVDTRKATALLIYLAERDEPQRRESLAAMFWPESDGSHAKAALRRTLSALRKAVGADWVTADRETIALTRPWLDTTEFRSLTQEHQHKACERCIEELTRAVELYRDEFLSGFTLPDSPAFDEWQYFTAQSLLAQYSEVLHRLVRLHEAEHSLERSLDYATRRLALDPLNEAAHRDLMTLHAGSGQRGMALQQYRDCVRILQQELGAPPLEPTVELYEKIKAGDPTIFRVAPELAPDLAYPAGSPALLPLIGRRLELDQLGGTFAAIKHETQLSVLQGEAGVGKTRLAEEFLRGIDSRVLQARCYREESSVAYRPWIDALRAGLSRQDARERLASVPDIWLKEAGRLIPDITELFPKLDPPPSDQTTGGQDRFLNGLAKVLGALASGEQTGIVFVDDLHWADESSLDFLSYLVRRGPDPPLYILAAWRAENAADEQRLRAWSANLPSASTHVMPLQLLSQGQVEELVGRLKIAAPAKRLYLETEGLPLFLAEYLAAFEAGDLEPEEGEWGIPTQVQEVIRTRLASISGASQQLLSTAAVVGRSFEYETLRKVSGRSAEETVSGLEELIAAGFIREFQGEQPAWGPLYDFRHAKLREMVKADTTQARQRLLHRRASEALIRISGGRALGPTASRVARHLELSGSETEAAEYYVEAGDHARGLYANEEAIAHYRSALALGYPDSAPLHEAIADLLTLIGKYDLAAQEFEAAAAFQDNGRTGQIEHKLGGLYERWGKRARAESHFEAAVLATEDDGIRARIHADWSLTELREGELDMARTLIGKALGEAESAQDLRALAQCHNMMGIFARTDGRRDAAREHLEHSLEYAEMLDDQAARAAALNNLALALAEDGDIDQSIRLEREALVLSESVGDRHRAAAIHSNLADMLHRAGDEVSSKIHLTKSAALFAEVGITSGEYEPEIWKLVEW